MRSIFPGMTDSNETPGTEETCLTVFYDGACPLCQREIGFYKKRQGADAVRWVDVSSTGEDQLAQGLSRQQALARFHIRDSKGRLQSGAAAFASLWSALPAFRLLGRIAALAPVTWLLEPLYRLFLKLRPLLQTAASGRRNSSSS